MKRGGKALSCILGTVVLCNGALAVTSDSTEHPYRGIVERNVFGLKQPAPPGEPPPPPPPPIKLTLTGITTLLGDKRALLTAQAPGKQPKSYMLAPGQREDEIEIVEIDEAAASVKVRNAGTEQTLDFKTAGAKIQVAAQPVLPVPGQPNPNPTAIPAPPGLRQIPTRSLRVQPAPDNAAPQPQDTPAPPPIPAPPPQ